MNQDDVHEIEKLHQTDVQAALSHDHETLLSLWTEDGVLLPPQGEPIRGKTQLQAMFDRIRAAGDQVVTTEYVQRFEELEIIDDWAFEWGTYYGTEVPASGGTPVHEKGKLMRILKKQPDSSWKVARAIYNTET